MLVDEVKSNYSDVVVASIGKAIFHRDAYYLEDEDDEGDGEGETMRPSKISSKGPESFDDEQFLFEIVDGYGGEGDGDQYWGIAKITNKATNEFLHVRLSGWYASYVGAECDDYSDWEPVKPNPVQKIEWVKA